MGDLGDWCGTWDKPVEHILYRKSLHSWRQLLMNDFYCLKQYDSVTMYAVLYEGVIW